MSAKSSGQGYAGQQGLTDNLTDLTVFTRLIEQILGSRVRTAVLVQIQSVTVDAAGLAPVGFVSAVPLVKQMDGAGTTFPHGTIFNLPYFRLQGGANAVILDPSQGDIGVAVICDRDISSVKKNKGTANPGSYRRFSMADGLYIGGFLNAKPTCRIYFNPPGGDPGMTMTPDDGVTSLTITPGLIRMVSAKIESHATIEHTVDANGTGFVLNESGLITTYSNSSAAHASTPPEVPT